MKTTKNDVAERIYQLLTDYDDEEGDRPEAVVEAALTIEEIRDHLTGVDVATLVDALTMLCNDVAYTVIVNQDGVPVVKFACVHV